MSACPELGALELSPLPPPISEHVASCPACQLVVDVFAGGHDDCLAFDALLAARADGTLNTAGKNLLDRHLASCATCREVAETLSPIADRGGDHAALPEVDPGAYELGLEVGRGGMGRVLAARDLRVGRPVAVKELLGRAPQLAARFEREARVTARLQHPGIVPIYEIGRWPDGTPFYAMRMVEGRSLLDVIDATPTLAGRLALLSAVIAASEAVAFAHSQRVIHRDLTPSNVLVGAYGETVVIDWGLAKDLSDAAPDDAVPGDDADPAASGDKLTGAGAVIGTAAYMPPEQAHAVPVDERADVYALGAILYHLLAGVAPFRAKTTRELLRDVRTGPPPPVGELAPGAPRDLVSIVEKAMARDPDQRYPSARELTEELKRFQTGRMVEAHAYSGGERLLRFVRRHKAAVAITAAATVLVGVVATISIAGVVRSRAAARQTVRELLVEEGRVELLGGNALRALAYLHEAYKQGITSDALAFLINSAIEGLPDPERLLDCGGDVRYIAFSHDGKRVIGACHDVARMWDVATGATLMSLGQFEAGFDKIALSHDDRLILAWGDGGVARLWDAQTGAPRGTFTHGAAINMAALTPDDAVLATMGNDGKAQIWNTATGALERTIAAKTSGLLPIYGQISTDGQRLFTISLEGDGKAWDLATGTLIGGFQHGNRALVIGGDLAQDGTRAVTCGTDRLAKVWDTSTGAQLLSLGGHTDVIWKCVFSPDGTRLLTASHDGTAKIWDLATGAAITSVDHGDILLWARFSPDGRRFLTVGVDGLVKVWNPRSGKLLASHDSLGGKDAHFSPDGTRLVAQRGDGRVQIWKEAPLGTQFVPPAGMKLLAASSDGTRAVLEGADGAVVLYDTATGAPLAHAALHAPIALSRDGRVIAGTGERAVLVLDLATGATRHVLAMPAPDALDLTDDGARLAVTTHAGAPELWDVPTASRILAVPGATRAVQSRSGLRLVAWTPGEPPFVWDVETRRKLAVLAPAGPFEVLGFSGDGTRVALSEPRGDVHRVTLWDAGVARAPLVDVLDTSIAATFDPSGENLSTIGPDRVLTVWRVSDGTPITSFVLDQLLQAQANAHASLIAGLGDNGASLVVLSSDGRVLWRAPIEHAAPAVSPFGFRPPDGTVWWSADGQSIVAQSIGLTRKRVDTQLDRARVEGLVAAQVPWRVDGGPLVWIDKVPLRGTVTRGGKPVAGAKIVVEFRRPPHHGSSTVTYSTMEMQRENHEADTRADGTFELGTLLPPGRYRVTVRAGEQVKSVEADVGVDNSDVTIELAP